MNTARIVVTAAFTKGMPNFHTIPQVDPIQKEIALYHALPYGLHDGLGRDSGQFSFAEGWIRHNPLGYSAPDFKPLEQILHASVLVAKPSL